MKPNELVAGYFGARRLHDAAVGDVFGGIWSKMLQHVAALRRFGWLELA